MRRAHIQGLAEDDQLQGLVEGAHVQGLEENNHLWGVVEAVPVLPNLSFFVFGLYI